MVVWFGHTLQGPWPSSGWPASGRASKRYRSPLTDDHDVWGSPGRAPAHLLRLALGKVHELTYLGDGRRPRVRPCANLPLPGHSPPERFVKGKPVSPPKGELRFARVQRKERCLVNVRTRVELD